MAERMRIDGRGNVKIAGIADRSAVVGTNALHIFDGDSPQGTLVNGCSIYSNSGELYTMDAAGNAVCFSALELPNGINTGDIIRYNAISGQWETTVEPFYFKGLVLTPQAAASVSTEGAMYYDSALKAVIIGVKI